MHLECDYLVIGSGAFAMAFVDEILHSTKDITFIIIDKHHKPGGHWNDAYEFVTLHQPAQFYGVKSKILEKRENDLATCYEIRAYYEEVMREFLSTGRVWFYPHCEYEGENVFHSLLEPELKYSVKVNRKTVDATYNGPTVPSVRKPQYEVSEGVHLVPVNGLANTAEAWEQYMIIGGGKTGVDAVLYLLGNGVKADRISWIIPNDLWMFNRSIFFSGTYIDELTRSLKAVLQADTWEDLVKLWEKDGFLMRLDESVEPRRFRAATVTKEELAKLRLVTHVIRKGRVKRLEVDRIVFENELEVETNVTTLHVDCTSIGANPYFPKPIFKGSIITLQQVVLFQTCYSGSIIGAFEAKFPEDEEKKNMALVPMTHPQDIQTHISLEKQNTLNAFAVDKELGMIWGITNRLNMDTMASLGQLMKFVYFFYSVKNKYLEKLDILAKNVNEHVDTG